MCKYEQALKRRGFLGTLGYFKQQQWQLYLQPVNFQSQVISSPMMQLVTGNIQLKSSDHVTFDENLF